MRIPLFFLLATAAAAAFAATAAKKIPPPVLDINNNTVLVGTAYFILPASNYKGGLTLSSSLKAADDDKCPLDVIEDLSSSAASTRLSVTFYPATNDTVVRTSTDNNFVSANTTECPRYSTVWRLGRFEDSTGKWYLTTGGTIGRPGVKTVSNWLKIEPIKGGYKLVFCPHVCRFCKVVCGDIGIAGGNMQKRLLGLSNAALPVVFKKK